MTASQRISDLLKKIADREGFKIETFVLAHTPQSEATHRDVQKFLADLRAVRAKTAHHRANILFP